LLKAWSGLFCVTAFASLEENATSIELIVSNVTVVGATSSQVFVGMSCGSGAMSSSVVASNTSLGIVTTPLTPGYYTFRLNASNWAGNTTTGPTLHAAVMFDAQYYNGGNSSGSYPSAVSVWVGASPVTGPAPLATTLSAYISGGSPPFLVTWSLPGSNLTGNATGLMVSVSYSTGGWYPATAFVYNTTTAWGQVLVGYSGVWLYASGGSGGGGNGSGNGTGNGSGNGSGLTPIAGHLPGATTDAQLMAGSLILVAALAGAVVGAVAGFRLGRRAPALVDPQPSMSDRRRTG
jgi:hypothetical protein